VNCETAAESIQRRLDGELTEPVSHALDAHLAGCPGCARRLQISAIFRRMAKIDLVPEPSPFFYRKVREGIEGDERTGSLWQVTLGLARYFVPALAAITLAFLSLFAYYQIADYPPDIYQAYDTIFTAPDRPQRMIISEPGDITDDNVLEAMAEGDNGNRAPAASGNPGLGPHSGQERKSRD
jgi:hypothetical protein